MATTNIPLNTFRLVTDSLDGSPKSIYSAPANIASIILSVQISNLGEQTERISAFVEKNNEIHTYSVSSIGSGYLNPTVTVGRLWVSSSTVVLNEQYFYSSSLYTVTKGGITGGTPPTHTNGSVVSGTSIFTYAGVRALATASLAANSINSVFGLNTGSGYISRPIIYITDASGSNATASAVLSPIITELVRGAYLPKNDAINPLMGKLVLEQFNKLIISGSSNCKVAVSLLETANE
jgi:hypothetical protein